MTTPSARPIIPIVRLDTIPRAMRETPQWLLWRYVFKGEKWTKAPVLAGGDGRGASKTDPRDWLTFADAVEWYKRYTAGNPGCVGLGFCFTADDDFVFIDLDHCRDLVTGEIVAWAQEYMRHCETYFEVSPRGEGLHGFGIGRLTRNRRVGAVEVYDRASFATVTGVRYADMPADLCDIQAGAAWIEEHLAALRPVRERRAIPSAATPTGTALDPLLPDAAIVRQIRSSRQREKFGLLFDAGDYVAAWALTGRGAGEKPWSQSEGVQSLLCILMFWTLGDATRTDRLFRESALYVGWEQKWERLAADELAQAYRFVWGSDHD